MIHSPNQQRLSTSLHLTETARPSAEADILSHPAQVAAVENAYSKRYCRTHYDSRDSHRDIPRLDLVHTRVLDPDTHRRCPQHTHMGCHRNIAVDLDRLRDVLRSCMVLGLHGIVVADRVHRSHHYRRMGR